MLSVFRKNANNGFMLILFAAIAFVFVFTFGSWGGQDVTGRVPIAATVNDKVIPLSLFQTQYSQTYQAMASYRPGFNADQAREEKLDQTVLDRLITRELLAQAGEARGLVISDDEVAELIETRFFGRDKKFDPEEYKRIVQGLYNTTEARFEEQIRRDLLAAKMEQILGDSQHVSEKEVLETFESKNNRADLEFVKIDPLFWKSQIKDASDADAMAWAESNKADVEKFYHQHMNRYRQPKKVKARHILAKVQENASEDDKKKAREKIEAAKKRVDGGEDFAQVATEVSEDASAKSGGDLGFFGPGAMVKPFEEAAFALEKGKVSEIVETRFGFHIIKVEDIQEPVTKELKDVQIEIAKQLMRERSQMAEAKKVAAAALAELQKGTAPMDLKIPGIVKPPTDGTPPPEKIDPFAPRVDTTGMFAQSARVIPKIGVAPEVVKIAFALDEKNPVHPAVVEVNNRLFLLKLKARERASPDRLAAERESIKASLLAGRRSQIVETFVQSLRERARIKKEPNLLGS